MSKYSRTSWQKKKVSSGKVYTGIICLHYLWLCKVGSFYAARKGIILHKSIIYINCIAIYQTHLLKLLSAGVLLRMSAFPLFLSFVISCKIRLHVQFVWIIDKQKVWTDQNSKSHAMYVWVRLGLLFCPVSLDFVVFMFPRYHWLMIKCRVGCLFCLNFTYTSAPQNLDILHTNSYNHILILVIFMLMFQRSTVVIFWFRM